MEHDSTEANTNAVPDKDAVEASMAARHETNTSLTDGESIVTPPNQAAIGQVDMPMNMSSLAGALPHYGYRANQQIYQHSAQVGSAASMMYQYPSGQYPGMTSNQANPYTQQLPLQYQGQQPYQNYTNNPNMATQQYPNAMYMTNHSMMTGSAPTQFQAYQHEPAFHSMPGGRFGSTSSYTQMHGLGVGSTDQIYPVPEVHDYHTTTASSRSAQIPSALRGPPRKPRQSGHALWVGNLPPGANIIDLKDHFAREATDDIESVFLISKSNCAFVNYTTEASCAAAMSRFHDSRFQGIRLVCRLRRGTTTSNSTVNVGTTITTESKSSPIVSSQTAPSTPDQENAAVGAHEQEIITPTETDSKIKERFFIIKSLTIEDLERSVQTGIWATQSHNETALNKAYHSAENVYLIFSANKSGGYFGYARMESAIDDESAAQIASQSPKVEHRPLAETQPQTSSILPVTIPTAATATAPPGHIIDDSARGTIFWEAEQTKTPADDDDKTSTTIENDVTAEGDQAATTHQSPASASPMAENSSSPPSSPSSFAQTAFGKPFRISWHSTDQLPFYRTRGLRNPWNTNREVKIARDGTEIEPSVGRKLVDMFGTQPPIQPRGLNQPAPFSGPLIVGPGFGANPQGSGFNRGY